jgi:hypothetical protein
VAVVLEVEVAIKVTTPTDLRVMLVLVARPMPLVDNQVLLVMLALLAHNKVELVMVRVNPP